MPPSSDIVVAGYFPPPLTGQAVATERLVSLLAPVLPVARVPLRESGGSDVRQGPMARVHRAADFARASGQWRRTLGAHPGATVLWASVSPKPLSHLRDVAFVLPALRADQRVYAVLHWGNFDGLGHHALLRPTVRALVRRLDGFVFLSDGLADRCAPFIPPEKRFVIPNTVDDRVIATTDEVRTRRQGQPSEPFRILFLGTMFPDKGVFDVLDALAHLRARGLDAEATFAGGWPSDSVRHRFEQQAARLGGAVQYAGMVHDRADLRRLLLSHSVLALPSTYAVEAQPLVLLEALATATPVVTTSVGAIPEFIQHGQEGYLVPTGDPAALADALARLRDPSVWQAASVAARARFDRSFAPAVVRQAWLQLVAPAVATSPASIASAAPARLTEARARRRASGGDASSGAAAHPPVRSLAAPRAVSPGPAARAPCAPGPARSGCDRVRDGVGRPHLRVAPRSRGAALCARAGL